MSETTTTQLKKQEPLQSIGDVGDYLLDKLFDLDEELKRTDPTHPHTAYLVGQKDLAKILLIEMDYNLEEE